MRRDLCSEVVPKLRRELLLLNGIPPIVDDYRAPGAWSRAHYETIRLELAKKICAANAKQFAYNRRACQKVLDTIDELFLATG